MRTSEDSSAVQNQVHAENQNVLAQEPAQPLEQPAQAQAPAPADALPTENKPATFESVPAPASVSAQVPVGQPAPSIGLPVNI